MTHDLDRIVKTINKPINKLSNNEILKKRPTPKLRLSIIERLMTDFLIFSGDSHIDRKGIESVLYNIEDATGVIGRAVYIGSGYFITAYHVVEGDSSLLSLSSQVRKNTSTFLRNFQVVAHDSAYDLALLQAPVEENEGEAKLYLANRTPSIEDVVAEFIIIGDSVHPINEVHHKFSGRYQFGHSRQVPNFGKLILPTNSSLMEKQGIVFGLKEGECYTSVPVFHGESGSPIFCRIAEGTYAFVGIIVRGNREVWYDGLPLDWLLKHGSILSNSPEYKDTLPRARGAIFVSRDPIEILVRQYINQSSPQPSR